MSHAKEIRNTNLRELLIQHWEHFRHIETERYWFLSVYATLSAAGLALILGENKITGSIQIWLILFLTVLTIIGLIVNIRWMQTLDLLAKQIKNLADKLDGMSGVQDKVDFEAHCNGVWKILRTRYLFPSFYVFVLIGLIIIMILPK